METLKALLYGSTQAAAEHESGAVGEGRLRDRLRDPPPSPASRWATPSASSTQAGRVETEGKKVLSQFQRPPTQLRATLDRLGTDNSTDSGGPNEAVYQGFDPIPAIHIIPRC